METPILDIVMSKPEEPIEEYLFYSYAINIIKVKREMQAILNTDITFNN